jgi:hypothetical protein
MKQFIDYLQLKKPITLRIIPRINSDCDAEYEPEYSERGKLCEHVITVYTRNPTRDFDVLIAHELIHAWQEEKKLTETHGPAFIKRARKMEKDFGLHEIYIPDIDAE